jgi:alkylation response protein AidB-like acyl-CoA dehydrogenase
VAHRALAAELIGTAGEVLRLAVEHTSTRSQFGAPIAAFQAVRHRLADAHVAIAAAQALLDAAFVAGDDATARAAKAQAGRAHEQASAHALQVCGAIGSSLEHPLHTFVSRGVVLDALLGGWAQQVDALGHGVLTTGTTPLLIDV